MLKIIFFVFLPSPLIVLILRFLLGFDISWRSRFGFSIIKTNKIKFKGLIKIGHFNYLAVDSLCMNNGARISHFNFFKGPFNILMSHSSSIGNFNKFSRAALNIVTFGKSNLYLNKAAILTSNHFLDMTCSIYFGKYSCLAGKNSQIWTHGYVHNDSGLGRHRVDGSVHIGNNVYIGSACILNPGLFISNGAMLAPGLSLNKDILSSVLVISPPPSYFEKPDEVKYFDKKIVGEGVLIERVYKKLNLKSLIK